MNREEIDTYKQQLLDLRSTLVECEQSSRESGSTVQLDQSRVGRLSRMDAMQAQQMALETARRRQLQLKKIEGALQRIASDEFGFCFKCGEDIEQGRLMVDPTSTRCMGCMDS